MPTIPIVDSSLMTPARMQAYYRDNPTSASAIDTFCPAQPMLFTGKPEDAVWKVIKNSNGRKNLVSPGVNLNSEIPVRGRREYGTVQGNFYAIADAVEKTKSDFGDYQRLVNIFTNTQDPAVAKQLLDFWDTPLEDLRGYAQNFRVDASYKLLSSAGTFKPDSPYYKCMTSGAYPIDATQKVNTAMNWGDPDADILADISTYFIDLPKVLKMLPINYVFINAKTFKAVQENNKLRKQIFARAYANNEVTGVPSLEEINALLQKYFATGSSVISNPDDVRCPQLVVVNDTLVAADGTAYNPFADGVAVGTASLQWGRFSYVTLENNPTANEITSGWLQYGNYTNNTEVRWQKIYMRGFAYPVLDSYDENIYLKTDGTTW